MGYLGGPRLLALCLNKWCFSLPVHRRGQKAYSCSGGDVSVPWAQSSPAVPLDCSLGVIYSGVQQLEQGRMEHALCCASELLSKFLFSLPVGPFRSYIPLDPGMTPEVTFRLWPGTECIIGRKIPVV